MADHGAILDRWVDELIAVLDADAEANGAALRDVANRPAAERRRLYVAMANDRQALIDATDAAVRKARVLKGVLAGVRQPDGILIQLPTPVDRDNGKPKPKREQVG